MNDKQIATFISAAQSSSFSAAAEKQYISPQALLQQINLLEKEIGVALFVRTRRGISLTPAGKQFYEGITGISAEFEALLSSVRRTGTQEKPRLRIGMFDMPRMMNRLCSSFHALHPEILQEYDKIPSQAWLEKLEDIKKDRLDVFEHADVPQVHESGLSFAPLIRSKCLCAMDATHPLARKHSLRLSDLNGQTLAIHDASCVSGLTAALQREAPDCRLLDRNNSVYSAFDVCASGGVFLVSEYFADVFQSLHILPLDCDLFWIFGIVYKTDPSPIVQLFLDNARAQFPASEGTEKAARL